MEEKEGGGRRGRKRGEKDEKEKEEERKKKKRRCPDVLCGKGLQQGPAHPAAVTLFRAVSRTGFGPKVAQ